MGEYNNKHKYDWESYMGDFLKVIESDRKKVSPKERAKEILNELENSDELMSEFNSLLRIKKLKNIKKKK